MATYTYKVLGQQNPSAAAEATLYTCGASGGAIISTITVCNRSATATTFRLSVRPAAATLANQMYVAYDADILGNEVYTFTCGLTLANTDLLTCYATLATLSFSAFGQEIT